MTRKDALCQVIECLHAEIDALKANDVAALEAATQAKLGALEIVAANDNGAAPDAELRALAEEAHKLNETARIYVNLMAANVRRRLQDLAGATGAALRPAGAAGRVAAAYGA
ncbi:flagellar protein FlgN [Sphingomonas sp. BGYR3]|uniref:flagellar protein FlgN n=1 Tax=Sphingomonas sp. BGYR3 TaxID=2975483 RepID=UPI0021A88E15|nr:flagellar protein FlgN [Sphingomonas sp. BGYR3]MDG5488984.1 flagellar protein FlgN [Sphingomonas sp. BGYR3]